jgi:hypothetical protein
MQSVMQMFMARFASRNPCISRLLVLSKKPEETRILLCLASAANLPQGKIKLLARGHVNLRNIPVLVLAFTP